MDRRTALKALALGGIAGGPFGTIACRPPPPITVAGKRRFEHPETEADILGLVERARTSGVQMRVRGSLHSHAGAIFTDDHADHVNVQLDRYNRIVGWDVQKKQVTVEAGIHLGVDPLDPGSNADNSLLHQLDKRGWALPDLGGITHQTVGGFLSTGSAGGSVKYDVGESIVSIRIVAGDGKIYELKRNPNNPTDALTNPFYGVGVAMGLYGVISTVTFQCIDRYDLVGKQVTADYSGSPVDLFGTANGGLRKWMEDETYNRLLLWPQLGVERVQLWSAHRATPEELARIRPGGQLRPQPLKVVPKFLQALVRAVYDNVQATPPPYTQEKVKSLKNIIKLFISNGTEEFWDAWLECLPMDDKVSDRYLATEFTELFIDIDRTAEVMAALKAFWAGDDRMNRTGPFSVEVYPSKASHFWMSPSYQKDKVRIDVFWLKSGPDPDGFFYPQYWELLRPFGVNFHWGKHLSRPESSTGLWYRRERTPSWREFMKWRAHFDPEQIFVSQYWRDHLGICRVADPTT
jgi:FAD/FMN-containing dehydrogenase